MGCGNCDKRRDKKRIRKLARAWEEKTGEKTEVYQKRVGTKLYWDFRVVKI